MKAIETEYAGVRFRSRLEARWAVFFDALRIRWEYEPEAFALSDGTAYLPDFWLPDYRSSVPGGDSWVGAFAEVKPSGCAGDAFTKANRLRNDLARDGRLVAVLNLRGEPERDISLALTAWRESFGRLIEPTEYFAAIDAVRAHRFWDPKGGA